MSARAFAGSSGPIRGAYPGARSRSRRWFIPMISARLEQALREGLRSCRPVEYTHRLATADARRWLWCHTRAERIPYDSPRPMLLVTGSDVSAYKEKEQRLTESNRRLRTAF